MAEGILAIAAVATAAAAATGGRGAVATKTSGLTQVDEVVDFAGGLESAGAAVVSAPNRPLSYTEISTGSPHACTHPDNIFISLQQRLQRPYLAVLQGTEMTFFWKKYHQFPSKYLPRMPKQAEPIATLESGARPDLNSWST